MAGVKISGLPAVAAALTTDYFPVVQAGITSRETLAQVQTLFGFSGGILAMANGGTGAALTATNNALVYSNATNLTLLTPVNSASLVTSAAGLPTLLGPMTNGQLVIGSTGAIPVIATLTAGTGMTITNAAGAITLAATGGGLTWNTITTATQTIAVNNGYISNRGGGVAFALPATSAVGDAFSIVGKLGTWSITQAAAQQINVGAVGSTVGATGTLTSAAATDSANFICITANTIWQVQGGPQTAGFVLA